jgi:hypothetical protein
VAHRWRSLAEPEPLPGQHTLRHSLEIVQWLTL